MAKQANLGTLNIVSGTPTRVGLPLDYILPQLDKIEQLSNINRQKISETKIALSNLPILDKELDQPFIDDKIKEVNNYFEDIVKNEDWSRASSRVIDMAEKLATDTKLRNLTSNVAKFNDGMKQIAENKDLSIAYKDAIIQYNKLRYKEQGGSFTQDGEAQDFGFWMPSSNLTLEPFKEKLFENAQKLKADQEAVFERIDSGIDVIGALESMGEYINPELRNYYQQEIRKTGTIKRLSEEKIMQMNQAWLSSSPEYVTTLQEIIKLNHFKSTGKLQIDETDTVELLTKVDNPVIGRFLLDSSLKYQEAIKIVTDKTEQYNDLVIEYRTNPNDALARRINTLEDTIHGLNRTIKSLSKEYIREGSEKVLSSLKDNYQDIYNNISYAALNANVMSSNLGLAYKEENYNYTDVKNVILDLLMKNASNSLSGNGRGNPTEQPFITNQVQSTTKWNLDKSLFDSNSEWRTQYSHLVNLEKNNSLNDTQRQLLNQYRIEYDNALSALVHDKTVNKDKYSKLDKEFTNLIKGNPLAKNQLPGVLANEPMVDKGRTFLEQMFPSKEQKEFTEELKNFLNGIDINKLLKEKNVNDFLLKEYFKFVDNSSGSSYLSDNKKIRTGEFHLVKSRLDKLFKRIEYTVHDYLKKYISTFNESKSVSIPMTEMQLNPNLGITNDFISTVKNSIAQGQLYRTDNTKFVPGNFITNDDKKSYMDNMQIHILNSNGTLQGKFIKIVAPELTKVKVNGVDKFVQTGNYITEILKYDANDTAYNAALVAQANHMGKHLYNPVYRNLAMQSIKDVTSNLANDIYINKEPMFEYLRKKEASKENLPSYDYTFSIKMRGTESEFKIEKLANTPYLILHQFNNSGESTKFKINNINDIPSIIGSIYGYSIGINKDFINAILNSYILKEDN